PERMVRRRSAGLCCLPVGGLNRRRHQVVHERASLDVAALVVTDHLHERDSQTLGQAAVDLTLDYHRIDDVAAIVNGDKPPHFDLTCSLVDIDDAYIGSKRERKVRRIIIVDRFQPRFQAWRQVGIGGKGDFLDSLGLVWRALDIEFSRLPFQSLFAHLLQVRRDLFGFVAYLSGCDCRGGSGNRGAAARIGTQAVWSSVGVAFFDRDSSHWNAQLLRDYLCKRSLVTL